ncbi:MAG: type 4a pilus biogenesis protein PilO [Deltaproteobacteria bacterium]|nr:type 4a pilus biogenesis protein PilO [Candidatus Anaeroferrophillacea bacterium]
MAGPDLDFIHTLPTAKKVLALVAMVAALVGIYAYFFFLPGQQKLERLDKKLRKSQMTLAQSRQIASRLPEFEQEITALQITFKAAASKLPDSREIPELLLNISRLGKDNGLEFRFFEPKKEVPAEFYHEVPIDLEITGGYHATASFFTDICTLPRIVTIHDYMMHDHKVENGRDAINTRVKLVTYTFRDQPQPAKEAGR